MKQKYLMAALMAGMLVLAGCGGGNSSDPDPDPPMPDPMPPGPTGESLAAMAQQYRNDEDDALMEAMEAVNPMGDTMSPEAIAMILGADDVTVDDNVVMQVMGKSMAAEEHAQAILDAQMMVDQAIMDVYDALKDAMDHLKVAMDLPDDDANKDLAVDALEDVIDELKMQFMMDEDGMVEMDDDGNPVLAEADAGPPANLAEYKKMIDASVGVLAGDAGMKMASDTAESVAELVLGILESEGGVETAPNTDGVTDDQFLVMGNNRSASAMTYDQIFRTTSVPLGNSNVDAVSLSGVDSDADLVTAADDQAALKAAGVTYTYKGIAGTVLCRMGGEDCMIADDDTLGAGWYFLPLAANRTVHYVMNQDGDYEQARYAEYGMWMTITNSQTVINRYSGPVGPELSGAEAIDLSTAHKGMATYEGMAEGLSVKYDGVDKDGDFGHESGLFMADVALTLDLGDADTDTMLTGTIDNFRGVDNPNVVDPAWTLVMEVNESNENVLTGGRSGTYTANPYGSVVHEYEDDDDMAQTTNIPAGYHGAFNARFGNGGVAGVYAAEKN